MSLSINKIKKVSACACLFLCLQNHSTAQNNFSQVEQTKYFQILDLNFENILVESSVHDVYLNGLSSALDALINENPDDIGNKKEHIKQQIQQLYRGQNQPEKLYYIGQLRWLFAVIELNQGNEFSSLLQLRHSNKALIENTQHFPDYKPNIKLGATLSIIFGSVPESQKWAFDLLGLNGSVMDGIKRLINYQKAGFDFSTEAVLLTAVVNSFLLNNHDPTLNSLETIDAHLNLAKLLESHVLLKAGKNSDLLSLLSNRHAPLPIFEYLLGEGFYRKGEYDKSIDHFVAFGEKHKGVSNKKDALYKIGLCYYLKGDQRNSEIAFEKAERIAAISISDKYAKAQLGKHLPNISLAQTRHFTDGGYFVEATSALANFDHSVANQKDKVEATYRKANIAMLSNQISEAIVGFREVIKLGQNKEWYFAPNSALKLGYIFSAQHNKNMAVRSFELVLSYKDFEYESSIKLAARAGLAQINSHN